MFHGIKYVSCTYAVCVFIYLILLQLLLLILSPPSRLPDTPPFSISISSPGRSQTDRFLGSAQGFFLLKGIFFLAPVQALEST